MKNLRRGVMCLVLAVGAAGGLALAQQAGNFNNDYQRLTQFRNENRVVEGLTLCERMLTSFKDPAQVRDILVVKGDLLNRNSKFTEAAALAAKIRADYAQDKDAQAQAGLILGDALRGQKKFAEAVETYQTVARTYAGLPEAAAEALLRAGDTLALDLKKVPEGLAAYKMVETQPAVPRASAEALKRTAAACESARDFAGAAAAYQTLAEKFAGQFDENWLANNYTRGVEMWKAAGKHEETLALAGKAENAFEPAQRKAPFALLRAKTLVEAKKPAEARAECDRIICSYPLEVDICQTAQGMAVEAYKAESKFPEALGAARILYDAAGSEQNIRAAAQTIAQAFRSADGNLVRANEFLAYQRFGPNGPDAKPGTADDIKVNQLAQVAYPPADAARDKRFGDAVAAQPATPDGWRAKGYLYVYWGGKAKEGAKAFQTAFRSCPEAAVPQAAQELVLVGMKAVTASFAGLDKVFEFISYGSKGKSGSENIPDPFAGLR